MIGLLVPLLLVAACDQDNGAPCQANSDCASNFCCITSDRGFCSDDPDDKACGGSGGSAPDGGGQVVDGDDAGGDEESDAGDPNMSTFDPDAGEDADAG